jgi:DnaK suppressor protein
MAALVRWRVRTGKELIMNNGNLSRFTKLLRSKQLELSGQLRNRDGIVIEKAPDALDEVQHATERELAIRNLDRESRLLRSVRSALQRVADGSYGICLHCEEEISPRRLEALPWASYCIRCQELADSRRDNGEEVLADLLDHAA